MFQCMELGCVLARGVMRHAYGMMHDTPSTCRPCAGLLAVRKYFTRDMSFKAAAAAEARVATAFCHGASTRCHKVRFAGARGVPHLPAASPTMLLGKQPL